MGIQHLLFANNIEKLIKLQHGSQSRLINGKFMFISHHWILNNNPFIYGCKQNAINFFLVFVKNVYFMDMNIDIMDV